MTPGTTRANDEDPDDATLGAPSEPTLGTAGVTPSHMDGAMQERIDALFVAAIELPVEEQARFVQSQTRDDPAVRAAVISLLDADARIDTNFAARSPLNLKSLTTDENIPDRRIGQQIGDYVIQSRIDSGGFGTVYRATRAEPYREEVAVKCLHQNNLADEAIVQRVLREMQALSDLRHPNIVTQLMANVTQDGEPYIVMELVDGVPLDDYCNQNQLTIDERLRLFQKVCAAVQFAHENGWVHRDLKPSNILVTREGEPKLLDFGIAKLTKPSRPNAAVSTRDKTITFGPVGTPQYMSPEQFNGEDPRASADVYALGAILYELISGHRVFDVVCEGVDKVLMDAIRRAVCETMPKRPSTLVAARPLSQTGISIEQVADERRSNPASLKRCLEGDVDNIAMMALRKEPERRYASAAAVAEDIQRWLEHRPVRAQPDSWAYRIRKFVRRNRVALSVAAALLTALVVTTMSLRDSAQIRSDRDAERSSRLLERTSRLVEASVASIRDDNIPRAVSQLYVARTTNPDAQNPAAFEINASIDRMIAAWSRYLGTPLSTRSNVRTVYSRDGNRLAVVDANQRSLAVWDTRRQRKLAEIALSNPMEKLAFSHDNASVVFADHTDRLTKWTTKTNEKQAVTLPDSCEKAYDVCQSESGEKVLALHGKSKRVLQMHCWNSSQRELELIAEVTFAADIVDAQFVTDSLIAIVFGSGSSRTLEMRETENFAVVYAFSSKQHSSRCVSPDQRLIALNYVEAVLAGDQSDRNVLVDRSVLLRVDDDKLREVSTVEGHVVDVSNNGNLLLKRKQELSLLDRETGAESHVRDFRKWWTSTAKLVPSEQTRSVEVSNAPRLHAQLQDSHRQSSENVTRRFFPVAFSNQTSRKDRSELDSSGRFLVFDHRIDNELSELRPAWFWAIEPFLLDRPSSPPRVTEPARTVVVAHGTEPDRSFVVLSTGTAIHCMVSTKRGQNVWRSLNFDSKITAVATTNEPGNVLLGDINGFVHRVDLDRLAVTETIGVTNAPICSLQVDESGTLIVATRYEVSRGGDVYFESIDEKTQSSIQLMRLSSNSMSVLVAAGETLSSIPLKNAPTVDLQDSELELGQLTGQLCDVAGSQGKLVAAMIEKGRAVIVRAGGDVQPLGDSTGCTCVRLSTDGKVAAVGYADGSIQLWDVPMHKALSFRMTAAEAPVEYLTFGNSDRVLVSCSEQNEICTWNTDLTTQSDSGSLRAKLETLTGYRLRQAFADDSRLVRLSRDEWLDAASNAP